MTPVELPTLVIPPSTTHTHTVVFLHGRGDNNRSFSQSLARWRGSTGRNLFETFPSFRWVFPQAPLRPLASSGGAEIWPQWFDVWSTRDFAEREEVQAEGLREMVPAVRALLREEAELLSRRGGGGWDRVVLAGISMGGATSVHTLCNLDVPASSGGGRLAAFMGFCSRCPFAGRGLEEMRAVLGLEGVPAHNEVLRRTPVLLEHCVDDPLVLVENGRRLRDTLREFGAQVEWKEYPVGGHWFHAPDGLDYVVEFLRKVVIGKAGVGEVDSDLQN
ncbi:hypothetical protein VTK56DRAFT_8431 [Thermocarpiscus australiensis]